VLRIAGSPKNSLLNPYPVALDKGEHGIRPVRQAGIPDNPDGLGDKLADAVAGPQRSDRERNQHARMLSRGLHPGRERP
jgi:hypothetical protein